MDSVQEDMKKENKYAAIIIYIHNGILDRFTNSFIEVKSLN